MVTGAAVVSGPRARAEVSMKVPRPVYDSLLAIRLGIEAERGRAVSLGETLEAVVEVWERTSRLVADGRSTRDESGRAGDHAGLLHDGGRDGGAGCA